MRERIEMISNTTLFLRSMPTILCDMQTHRKIMSLFLYLVVNVLVLKWRVRL